MLVHVLRRVSGLEAVPGDVVDATEWPENRVRQLIKQRRVHPVMMVAEKKERANVSSANHAR